MKCGNYFCIYEEKGKCILDNIELDISGLCESCIYINFPTSVLESKKSETRERIEKSPECN